MNQRRFNSELQKLDKLNIYYNIEKNNDKIIKIFFKTNHGIITMIIPPEYPFKYPRLFINTSSSTIFQHNYLKSILFDKLFIKLDNDIIENIYSLGLFDSVYNYEDVEYNKDVFCKKYINDLINRKTSKNNSDILFKYDEKLIDKWSPVLHILDIINILISLFNEINLKSSRELKFIFNPKK